MADLDDIKDGKDFGIGTPQQNVPYTLKGCGSLDWGMQSRLARIFNPQSNRTVMLAFDHGYFQGPTTGLERIDLSIVAGFLSWLCHGWSLLSDHRHRKRTVDFLDCPLGLVM